MGDRYYFDLEGSSQVLRDDKGVEAAGPEQAVEVAMEAIDEMRANEELPDGDWDMVVRDASGAPVMRLPIR